MQFRHVFSRHLIIDIMFYLFRGVHYTILCLDEFSQSIRLKWGVMSGSRFIYVSRHTTQRVNQLGTTLHNATRKSVWRNATQRDTHGNADKEKTGKQNTEVLLRPGITETHTGRESNRKRSEKRLQE
jgi:hypothetical protein